MEDRWKKFGEWLKQVRAEKGFTQIEAAKRAGLATIQQWSRYERGAAASRDRVIVLAEAIGVSRRVALKEAGFIVEYDGKHLLSITNAMLDALFDARREFGESWIGAEDFWWLSEAQMSLEIELDRELCLSLLRVRIEQKIKASKECEDAHAS